MANDTNNNGLTRSDLRTEPSRAVSSAEDHAAALSNQMLDLMIKNKMAAAGSDAVKGAVAGGAAAAAGSDAASAAKGAVIGGAAGAAAAEGIRSMQGGKETLKDGNGESQMRNLKDLSSEERAKILKDAAGSSDRIKNSEIIDHFKKFDHELMFKPADGIKELRTGDKFVKDGDREILFMPNGDKLSVNKDGSFDLKSKGGVEVKKEGGLTTITFANGDKVTFSKQGIETIQRGNTLVDFIDPEMFNHMRRELHQQFDGSALPRNSIDKLPNLKDRIVPEKKQLDVPGGIYEKLQKN